MKQNNKQKYLWLTFGVVAVLIIALIVVVSVPKSNENNGVIKIGVMTPLSGSAANWGDNFLAGAELAKKEINDAGGINGRLIRLVVEDDQCKPSTGVSAVNRLISVDKVDVIAGPVCSSVGGATLPIAQKKSIPSITVASAPHLTSVGDYIFRTYPSDAFQGKFGADFVYNNLSKRKAAIIYTKNDWGQGLQDVFAKRFKELGGKIVYDEGVAQGSSDLSTQISKVKASGADVLYFPVYPINAISGLKQIKELSLNISVVGTDSFIAKSMLNSPDAEGVLYTVGKIDNPESFVKKIKSLPGEGKLSTNALASVGYDTIMAFATVMESAGTNTGKIKNGLNALHMKGVSTPIIEFNKVGDLKSPQSEVMIIKSKKAEKYVLK